MFNISSPQCPLTLLILAYNTDYGQLDNAAGPVINSLHLKTDSRGQADHPAVIPRGRHIALPSGLADGRPWRSDSAPLADFVNG